MKILKTNFISLLSFENLIIYFHSNSNSIMSLQTRSKPTEQSLLIFVGFEFHETL